MRLHFVLPILALAAFSAADEAYLSLYITGKKIGYITYVGTNEVVAGRTLKRADSRTVMDTSMMGSDLKLRMDSTTWVTKDGKPVRMFFRSESGGRVQTIEAKFEGTKAKLTIDNSGQITKSELPLPTGAPIVDDALGAFVANGMKPGGQKDFFIFDSTTVSFVKNTAELNGPATVMIRGKARSATLVTIHDPRADTKIYLDPKGEFLKGEAPLGIEMLPETKAAALDMTGSHSGESIDIAEATSIHPTPALANPAELKSLTIKVSGRNLASIPNDGYQTAKGTGKEWTLQIHPPRWTEMRDPAISALKSSAPTYAKPSMHINSDSAEWKPILAKILPAKRTLKGSVVAIHDFIYKRMKPNAGIGVLRDAREVYNSKEGVCRDYAILAGTMLRSAGIPTRLASGLVSWDGTFYYHAWVEVWDGKGWYPVDTTSPDMQVSAAHVKLSEGNVEQAFTFPFLGDVKIHVIDAKR